MEAIERVMTMQINYRMGTIRYPRTAKAAQLCAPIGQKGQALVEFTLCFLLFLVIAWIPADFGLAFYSAQLASNAAREGARIGSAANPLVLSEIETETCRRLPSALLTDPGAGFGTSCGAWSNARVRVESVAGVGTCNQLVRVTVTGNYNYFFYQLLKLMGSTGNLNNTLISRQGSMRWEHQDC